MDSSRRLTQLMKQPMMMVLLPQHWPVCFQPLAIGSPLDVLIRDHGVCICDVSGKFGWVHAHVATAPDYNRS
jgi:hypothetical protein